MPRTMFLVPAGAQAQRTSSFDRPVHTVPFGRRGLGDVLDEPPVFNAGNPAPSGITLNTTTLLLIGLVAFAFMSGKGKR